MSNPYPPFFPPFFVFSFVFSYTGFTHFALGLSTAPYSNSLPRRNESRLPWRLSPPSTAIRS